VAQPSAAVSTAGSSRTTLVLAFIDRASLPAYYTLKLLSAVYFCLTTGEAEEPALTQGS
jgi:hypothetical protein